MKALIISDDVNVIETLNGFFQSKKFDTIVYRWLLKALDNIEEIRPDCVIVSSSEYPRHWKTLVQFIKSGIGGDNIAIFLYEPNPLSAEDEEKARLLGINGYITDFNKEQLDALSMTIDEYFNIQSEIKEKQEVEEEVPTVEDTISEAALPSVDAIIADSQKEPVNTLSNTGHFIFTHPISKNFVTGKYINYDNSKLTCKLDFIDNLKTLLINSTIESLTFFDGKKCISAQAKISDLITLNNEKLVVLNITKTYEEE